MITKILKFLIKKGHKFTVTKVFIQFCNQFSNTFKKIPLIYVFSTLFYKLNTNVELFHIAYRRKSHFIPVPVKQMRKVYIIFKWLYLAISSSKLNISYLKKIYNEIISVLLNKQNSISLKLKRENEIKAYKFQSKIHFRWH